MSTAPDPSPARWFKSSHSSGQTECVEVAFLFGGEVAVRDSKYPTGPVLAFSAAEWTTFIAALRVDRWDC
ncbi:DUF397 domain-containing protein [Nocardia tengchongensis]|uniref:DUF397 domain-containing protein n=1 Tax=Nocardia tengchongensis TaxID=2055889 RepID=A0ABX8CKB4_9NOCA|nr:DUF397 domain-containing protein [Nocardia tengchongensis]QVI20009.1 DUF397 domain-containing protein [Nocardia tengchongensis]